MRIAYCTNVRLPSERAHGHQIAQVCDALIHLGHEVTLFAPYRKNIVTQDYWSYYEAEKAVKLVHLGSFDPIDQPLLPKWVQIHLLNASMQRHLHRELQEESFDLLYTRTPALLPILTAHNAPVILELHQLPQHGRASFLRQARKCVLIACLTKAMRDALIAWGLPSEKVIAEGDAVDLRRFKNLPSREEARVRFSVPSDRKIVGYVGRLKTLGMEKGVKYLLEAIAASNGAWFGFIVGGPEGDRKEYEEMARGLGLTEQDVRFTGAIPAKEVPVALAAGDILAMPFPDLPHYRLHMSPLKMFEYMAAGRPLITSDLPTVRDVLSEETAIFCKPGDSQSLAEALKWIIDHPGEVEEKAKHARTLSENYSWEKRMERVLDAMKNTEMR